MGNNGYTGYLSGPFDPKENLVTRMVKTDYKPTRISSIARAQKIGIMAPVGTVVRINGKNIVIDEGFKWVYNGQIQPKYLTQQVIHTDANNQYFNTFEHCGVLQIRDTIINSLYFTKYTDFAEINYTVFHII